MNRNSHIGCIFVVTILLFLPVCGCIVSMLFGYNVLAWYVMDSIPDIAIAYPVKQAMSEWLLQHDQTDLWTDNEDYGCELSWLRLFNLNFCDMHAKAITGEIDELLEINPNIRRSLWSAVDCNELEGTYGSVPVELVCYGSLHDVNGNGIPDSQDAEYTKITSKHETSGGYAGHQGTDTNVDYSNGIPGRCAAGQCSMSDLNDFAIFTPVSGTVVDVGWKTGGYGWNVTIYNEGYYYYFSHGDPNLNNADPPVEVGDVVHPGDIVMYSGGCVGSSGGLCPQELNGKSSGPHLHFEARECGDTPFSYRSVNPALHAMNAAGENCAEWYY